MLVLKLRRVGKRHQPFYRLVVSEKRSKSDGKYLESLGWYNPHNKEKELHAERVLHWLNCGAQKTDTVHNILVSSGVIKGKKIPVHHVEHQSIIQEKSDVIIKETDSATQKENDAPQETVVETPTQEIPQEKTEKESVSEEVTTSSEEVSVPEEEK